MLPFLLLLSTASADSHASWVPMELQTMPVPLNWEIVGATPPAHTVELTFAVKQQGLQELHDTLMRVSTPSSPDYGKHLSNEEVNKMTAPDPNHIQAIMTYLKQHGAEPRAATPNGDMIVAMVTIETAERMLSAKYHQLQHQNTGAQVSRITGGYSLPMEIAAAVDFVAPTVHVPGVRRPFAPQSNVTTSELFNFNTPKNLRKLYSVGDAVGKSDKNKQAVTAFLEQGYAPGSLHTFWKLFCGGITCGKGDVKVVGDSVTKSAGTESMLDIESITGVAGNVASEFWGYAGRSSDNKANEPYMKWLAQMSSTSDADVPKIFSTSYGEDEGSWSLAAAKRLNVEFQKAGTRGITLLFAAGDEGANCKGGKFVPEGPGSSPYVTAVGGTAPSSGYPNPGSETAIGLSSGGFSDYWPMPDYQKAAVAKYLKEQGLPPSTRGYKTTGRAYPDIAAQATNFIVVAGLPIPGVSGTSCASPTAAGVFSLLNDLRLQNGKSTLGFLNPLIYSHSDAFNDITTGSGSGCGFSGGGWPAKQGWDAVTGVGTPHYAKLAKVVANLPSGERAGAVVV